MHRMFYFERYCIRLILYQIFLIFSDKQIEFIQQIADALQKFYNKFFGQVGVQLRSARLTRLLIEL